MADKPSGMTIINDVNGDVANEIVADASGSLPKKGEALVIDEPDLKCEDVAKEGEIVRASETIAGTNVTHVGRVEEKDSSCSVAEVKENVPSGTVIEIVDTDTSDTVVDTGETTASDAVFKMEEKATNEAVIEYVPAAETAQFENSETQHKNYKNVILQDWDFETGPGSVSEVRPAASNETAEIHINNNNNNSNNNNNNVSANVDADDDGGVDHKDVVECDGDDSLAKDTSIVPTGDDEGAAKTSEGLNSVKSEYKEAEESSGVNESIAKPDIDSEATDESIKPVLDKKKNPLKYSNLIVSNRDIVEMLDNSVERVYRPIIPAKDIFLSIELTKHMNKSLSAKNALDVKTPVTKVITELPKVIKTNVETAVKTPDVKADNLNVSATPDDKNDASKKGKKKPGRKNINVGDELERTIALRQLRDEFPTTRKRTHATKKVNHIPFLASSAMEKALTSSVNVPNKSLSGQRRRPCYLPDNDGKKEAESDVKGKKKLKENEEGNGQTEQDSQLDVSNHSNSSVPVVRTYCIKRKSTDSENGIKSALQTFASVTKHLQDIKDEEENQVESKPKKQKTVIETSKAAKGAAATPKKSKADAPKKRNLELEKLLGDEGAVRMLYDTQHKDDNNRLSGKKSRAKSTVGLKKDLMLKTKLVKNAVLRLSGVASDGVSLRGSRRSGKSEPETAPNPAEGDSLFLTSTPKVILYKPKKKQRAEASRILYRHSSSESFESLDGGSQRRASLEGGDVVKSTNASESAAVNGDLFKAKASGEMEEELEDESPSKVPRKSQPVVGKGLRKVKTKREGRAERESVDSSNSSKLTWSNVPVRKSSRPRVVSKKYSIWSSTSMDSLSVESLGLKKPKKASQELAKKLNFKEVRILQHGSLVQIVLSPSSTVLKSSFNEQVLTELKDAFDFLSEQGSCTAILLTSNGTTFCQGIDLNYVLSVEEDDRKQLYGNLLKCVKQFILSMANCKKPVIAAVHASAIGLGVTLLSYCDIVLSSDTATFYTPYVKLGQMSEGAATVTFPRIHKNLVSELLFKGEKLSATEALKYGLVTQVIPEEKFDEELMIIARRMASQSSQAMESMKLMLNKMDSDKIAATLDMECQIVLDHWSTNECINNIIKFLNSGEIQFRHLDGT